MHGSGLGNSEHTTPTSTTAVQIASGEAFEGQSAFPLREILRVLRERLWLIVVVALIFTGVASGVSLILTPRYEASITILIGQETGTEVPQAGSLQGEVQGLQAITQTMAEVIRSRTVAETVIQELGLQTTTQAFQTNLSSEQVRATQIIQVDYKDTDPERAQRVANAVGDVFSEQISELSPSANNVTATVLDRAELPGAPVDPNPLRNALLALAVGGVLAIAGALLLEYLDDSWRSLEEAERISGVPTFALIPAAGFPKKAETNDLTQRLVTIQEPHSASAEAYRTLGITLLHAFADAPPKLIVLTSHGAGEGKSTTCANLGVALAQAGKSVLILDCDFRKPDLHTMFGLPNLFGIVDVVEGERSVRDVCHEPVEGLKVVSVSPRSINPTRFLESQRFARFLAYVRNEYDHVLLSAPPVGLVSDPAILAAQSDGVLLVLDAQNTRKVAVRQSVRRLEAVGANVIGTVLSNFWLKNAKDVHYYEATLASSNSR